MTVLLTLDLPFAADVVEAVTTEMGVRENPPDGLIVHINIETPEGVRVMDVWETAEHFERFRDDRLMPAFGKILADRGIDAGGPPPQPTVTEARDLVRGA
jgi:hypothetical protein